MILIDAFLLSFIQALPNSSLFLGERILTGIADLFGGIILLVIGVLIHSAARRGRDSFAACHIGRSLGVVLDW